MKIVTIFISITIGMFLGCGKLKHPITHQIPGINLDTLQNPALTTQQLFSYLRARSLQDSEWEDKRGDDHYMEFSPVFMNGLPGNLEVDYFIWNGKAKLNDNYVAPLIPRRDFIWTSERTPLATRAWTPKGKSVKTGRNVFEGFPLICADDSIQQIGWPLEDQDRWSKMQLYDSLVSRIGATSRGANASVFRDGFALINKDSVVSIDFYTHTK